MDKVRVGVVGMGYWGPKIARVLHLDPNYDMVVACDLNSDSTSKKLALLGITNVPIVTHFEVLPSYNLDLVVVAVPPSEHTSIAQFFLTQSINVFVEKPIGLVQFDREKLVQLAIEKKVRLFVDHTYLFSAEFAIVKDIIESNEIGPISFYTSSRVNLGLIQESTNVVEDLMVHDLAILDVLKGEAPIRVHCVGNMIQPSRHFGTAFANFIYADNFIANLSVSWHSPVKIRQINIVGQSGAVTWDDTAGSDKVKLYNSRIENSLTPEDFRISYHLGDGRIPRVSAHEPLAKEFQEIFEALTSGKRIMNEGMHIVRTGKTLEAISESLKIGAPVDIS